MRNGSDWVSAVRDRASIVDVVAPYTTLKRTGSSLRGPCPLHDGSGPNFSVSPDRNSYRCFVCGAAGDVFSFLQAIEGLTFIEAAKQLAGQVGVEVPATRPRRRTAAEELRASFQAKLREQAATTSAPVGAAGHGSDGPTAGFWGALGVGDLADAWSLGVRTGTDGQFGLLPIQGGDEVPLGWLSYRLDRGRDDGRDEAGQGAPPRPVRVGLEPGSEPSAAHQLVMAPRIRQALHNSPAVLVDDPITVLALAARGFMSAIAPVYWGTTGTGEDGIITEVQARRLRSLGITELRLAIPPGRDTEMRQSNERAIYATEVVCVRAGIQPLHVDLGSEASSFADCGWEWVARFSGEAEDLGERMLTGMTASATDLFQMRVSMVARHLFARPARLSLAEAMDKVRPTLEAAQASGDRALYHAYMAWAAREFRLPNRSRLAALLESPGSDEAEIF